MEKLRRASRDLLAELANRPALRQARSSAGHVSEPRSRQTCLIWQLRSVIIMVTIGYWKIRGLAAPLRMTCSYAGAEYTSADYELQPKDGGGWDRSEWTSVKPGLMEKNAMMNLPYVLDGDVYIVQVLSAPPTAIPPARRAPCRRMPPPTAAAIAARAVQRVPRPPRPQVRAVWIECCRDSRGRAGAVRGDGPAQRDGQARVRRRMGC